jgi:hypothetical protein
MEKSAFLVLAECCIALHYFTARNGSLRLVVGSLPGIFDVLVDVLRLSGCGSNARVAETCLDALHSILWETPENRAQISSVPGIVDVLVDLLRYYCRGDTAVTRACCNCIAQMCRGCTGNKMKFGSTAVPALIVSALKTHGKTRDEANKIVVDSCCYAIATLCEGNLRNKIKFYFLDTLGVLNDELVSFLKYGPYYLEARSAVEVFSEIILRVGMEMLLMVVAAPFVLFVLLLVIPQSEKAGASK